MANETIVIKVALDTTDLKKTTKIVESELKGATDQATRTATAGGKQIGNALTAGLTDSLKVLRNSLLGPLGLAGAIATVGAGLFKLAKDTAEAVGKFNDLRIKTGLSAQTLSSLDVVLKQSGSSVEQFSAAMGIFSRQLGEAQSGNKELAKTFKALDIDINANAEGALKQVIKRFQELPNEAQKSAFATQVFGRSGLELIPTLEELGGDLDAVKKKMSELGLTITDEAASAADQLNDQFDLMSKQFQALKNSVGNFAIPALTAFTTIANQSFAAVQNLIQGTGDLGKNIDTLFNVVLGAGFGRGGNLGALFAGAFGGQGGRSLDELISSDVRNMIFSRTRPLPKGLFDTGGRRRQVKKPLTDFEKLQNALALLEEQRGIRGQLGAESLRRLGQGVDAFGLPAGPLEGQRPRRVSEDALFTLPAQRARQLGLELSNAQRFMKGFGDATDSVADIFERFGNNVARSFTNIKSLFDGLKNAVLGFFQDLLARNLQTLLGGTLGRLFGGGGGIGFGSFGGLGGGTFGGSIFGGGGGGLAAAGIGSLGSIFKGGGSVLTRAADFSASAGSAAAGLGGSGVLAGILPLLSNPITAIAAPIALLVGSKLIGGAKQRRSDEQAAGEMLSQALAAIDDLARAIGSDRVLGNEARGIFESQILGTFISQISSLKTKSVRESRLSNQVRDLQNVFEARVAPLIDEQFKRMAQKMMAERIDRLLIPEFSIGGITRGGLAVLHAGEMVLNLKQQASIAQMAGPQIFNQAGVPGIQRDAVFDRGGVMGSGAPIEINLEVQVGMSPNDAQQIAVRGISGQKGRDVVVNLIKTARNRREL